MYDGTGNPSEVVVLYGLSANTPYRVRSRAKSFLAALDWMLQLHPPVRVKLPPVAWAWQSFCLEAWVLLQRGPGDAEVLRFSSASGMNGFKLQWMASTGRLKLSSSRNGRTAVASTKPFVLGTWVHVAINVVPSLPRNLVLVTENELGSYQQREEGGRFNVARVFLDGMLHSDGSLHPPMSAIFSSNSIGPFPGSIDELRLWKGPRSRQQIRLKMMSPLTWSRCLFFTYISTKWKRTLMPRMQCPSL